MYVQFGKSKKKINEHKEKFSGTPLLDCSHCVDVSRLSRGNVPRLFRGHIPSNLCGIAHNESLRIYPYPMVWPLPRPWPETMVSIPLRAQKILEIKGFLCLEHPFLDLVSQTPRPRGRGRPLFADISQFQWIEQVCELCSEAKVSPKLPYLFQGRAPEFGREMGLVPPNSQSLAVKEFYFTASRICRQFFVKFLAPTFPGN